MSLGRVRFSLLALQVVVAYAAVLLGIRMYIEPRVYWRDLWILLFGLGFCAIVFWLFNSAPWTARFFAVGFVAGAALEFFAIDYSLDRNLVDLTPGTWTPEGWYPLALPMERLIVNRGWSVVPKASLPAVLAGMGVSGVASGVVACAVWRLVRRPLSAWALVWAAAIRRRA